MPGVGPTIGAAYPTLEEVFNLTRVFLNDAFAGATGTPGEGRIFVDSWSPNITLINAAIQWLQRYLRNLGVSLTKQEIFYATVPALTSPAGTGIPDQTVQVYLDYTGYWDGMVLHPAATSPALPIDFMVPVLVEERVAGSGTNFAEVRRAERILPSIYQTQSMGEWDWRNDALYFNGSIVAMDLRVSYQSTKLPKFPLSLPASAFGATIIPFQDAMDVLAYRAAYIFSAARVGDQVAAGLKAASEEEANNLANIDTISKQSSRYGRDSYGEGGNAFGWGPG